MGDFLNIKGTSQNDSVTTFTIIVTNVWVLGTFDDNEQHTAEMNTTTVGVSFSEFIF